MIQDNKRKKIFDKNDFIEALVFDKLGNKTGWSLEDELECAHKSNQWILFAGSACSVNGGWTPECVPGEAELAAAGS